VQRGEGEEIKGNAGRGEKVREDGERVKETPVFIFKFSLEYHIKITQVAVTCV